ncbi:enoyl-CoA hydratase/isomerase family protein [Nocardia nova SH22a]|uniref:Enoyl-CoA hydratase/isomerase family protein n=1 Tax=Nocardia nova SH22a TaxID=1415166 RepID=W5TGS0_9NOCA|nr:enoyl-CoA hydratase/isomerase family protein [Nocardia nova]AHH18392.1 enoyl-CoA hydratase/isomerase family protein [Nocardia nova SH22a]
MSDMLLFERRERVALLTLNRPDKLNAIDPDLHREFMSALDEVRQDDSVWALVITGAGRGFCSGVDLTRAPTSGEAAEPSQNERLDEVKWFGRQALAVATLDKPVIAAVNGVAAGMGMSLSLACDLRVGGERSRFRTAMVARSRCPDSGMSWFLTRALGYARAADLVLTNRDVSGTEAYRLGLLDRFVGTDDVVDGALELADEITHLPPIAVRTSKQVLQHALVSDLRTALIYEATSLPRARSAPNDAKESALAFAEKRPPRYTGT